LGYPYLSLYILALGGSTIEVGFINMLGMIAGIFLYPLGGLIADKRGRVKIISYSTILFAVAHLFYVFAWNWQTIALGQFLSMLFLFYMPAMNALEADSLPARERGKGFSIILAVPDAIRIIAPYLGGWLISNAGGGDEGLILALRFCFGVSTVVGFVIAWIRIKYLKETLRSDEVEAGGSGKLDLLGMLKESYLDIVPQIRWMNWPLKTIVMIQVVTAFSVSLTAPYWIIYAKEMIGLSVYQWSVALLISGVVGVTTAFPIGVLIDRYGARRMILISLALSAFVPLAYLYLPFMIDAFLGVVVIVCIMAVINQISMPAFATIIANMIPRNRRGRCFSLLGGRGIASAPDPYWGGGFLLFPFSAAGVYLGGYIYTFDAALPWYIMSFTMLISLVMVYRWVVAPAETHE